MATRSAPPVLSMMVTTREWAFASELVHIDSVVTEVVALCRACGFSPRQCDFNVPLALTEALANAIMRGNGGDVTKQVVVHARLTTQHLIVDVADEGPGFDLTAVVQGPDDSTWLEREQGRGVFLMRTLMDQVENAGPDEQGGHRLRLILHRA